MPTSKGVSVIICCFNSESRIIQTLEHIDNQVFLKNWELIIVDNNCTDNTIQFAKKYIKKSNQLKRLTKFIEEKKPGLNYARIKGINLSLYEYILFCDDDNWLNKNYIENGYQFLEDNLDFGIVGGCGEEYCEINPPRWFNRFKSIYAIGCRKDDMVTNVYGAGMLFRKKLLIGFEPILTDRQGKSLVSGGDSEICLHIISKGFFIRQLCSNQFYHFIPKEWLSTKYLYKMARGRGYSFAKLKMLKLKNNKELVWNNYRFKTDVVNILTKFSSLDIVGFLYTCNYFRGYWIDSRT